MTRPNLRLPVLLPDREAYRERLQRILPRKAAGTTASDSPAAAAAAMTFMYVGAIDGANPIRPLHLMQMSDGIAARRGEKERLAYYNAASKSAEKVRKLCGTWGIAADPWYASNSREGPRDETFKVWAEHGALIIDHTVKSTSPRGRYTLTSGFASLLDPSLSGVGLESAINAWQDKHLGPIAKARAAAQAMAAKSGSAVVVTLPGGVETRALLTGDSSLILKGFIENCNRLLFEPSVVFISESGQPVNVVDDSKLKTLGLDLKRLKLLPDALLFDVSERGVICFIEAVATDGPVTESRKALLTNWAVAAGIPAASCRFLTAFESRTAPPAKRCLPQLAYDTYAWFLDEPDSLLTWGPFPPLDC